MANTVFLAVVFFLCAKVCDAQGKSGEGTAAVGVLTAYGCEGASAWLSCPDTQAISVIKVTWGRTSLNQCKHANAKSQTCVQAAEDATLSTSKVKQLCDDRRSCSVHALGTYYGKDPCPGVPKYVTVEYKCITPVCKNVETDSKCNDWATGEWAKKHGSECLNNPVYMSQKCWKACTNCIADCPNPYFDDVQCDSWALRGECDANPKFMFGVCPKACKACAPEKVCRNALEDDRKCIDWAVKGECGFNPDWMYRKCRKACGSCVKGCVDIFYNVTQCREWAKKGACTKNPKWMLSMCTKSCNHCPTPAAGCNNRHFSQIDCELWRQQGECSINPVWMLSNCQKTCLCFQGDECMNAHRLDWQCDVFALSGECDRNPGWMIPNCKRSCSRCY